MFLNPRNNTTQFNGYSVEFSPFHENLVTVGTSQYFGVIGNGQQVLMEMLPNGQLQQIRVFETQDGIYDCCWSEQNENQIVSCCSNGSIKLWDIHSRDNFPIQKYHEHSQEVASVNWQLAGMKNLFLSASWDSSIKLWDPAASAVSVGTFHEHNLSVYNAVWSAQNPDSFASCSGDRSLKIWDIKQPTSTATIPNAHTNEILALDWNKYNDFQIVSGSVDSLIKIWDLRMLLNGPMGILEGHEYGIRRLKCNPHDEFSVGSVSYDMSVCLWDTKPESLATNRYLSRKYDHHTEFVLGIDFSLFIDGIIATCSWDRNVCIWNINGGTPIIHR